MTVNRMGTTRGKNNRKFWLTGTLTLGAVAASGGVAMAALHEEPEHSAKVSQSLSVKGFKERSDAEKAKEAAEKLKGQVCLRLDKKAQKAIGDAQKASKGGTITVPLNKVEVIPCPRSTGPAPAPTGTVVPVSPAPTTSTSAPVKTVTTPPPPPKTTTTPPKTVTPKPTVTSTAS